MNIPSQNECFDLIKDMKMMGHIIDHSVMVSNVSWFIGNALLPIFPELNLKLMISAALLHDITKTRSFTTHELHSETGGEMLSNMGYPEVGDIIRQHVLLDNYNSDLPITIQEIVNYSDKRVLHDEIVSLNKRLEYIKVRYARTRHLKERIKYMWAKTLDLESKIFSHLEINPDQLKSNIKLKIKKQS